MYRIRRIIKSLFTEFGVAAVSERSREVARDNFVYSNSEKTDVSKTLRKLIFILRVYRAFPSLNGTCKISLDRKVLNDYNCV